ncbi:hypothetical protein GGR54DRAFT_416036 [Hypoxylon sp. NC1633]|nr:hypothetical protein GGR54DRAFT_416036 [Hypoxylon sp. NC1633]
MGPGPKRKLSLPSSLLKELQPSSYANGKGRPKRQLSRRELRKTQRVQKKQSRRPRLRQSNLTSPLLSYHSGSDDLVDENDEEDEGCGLNQEFQSGGHDSENLDNQELAHPRLSKLTRKRLAQDDAEIADLERRLGLNGRKSLPRSFQNDGLGELLDGLDDDGERPPLMSKKKRKAEADEWLAEKRRKAHAVASALTTSASDDDDYELNGQDLSEQSNGSDLDTLGNCSEKSEDDNDGVDDEVLEGCSVDNPAAPTRPRENPYIAPTTGVVKYVPPSLRNQLGQGNEAESQLRRRIQGLINRLTNDNMIGIVKDFIALYDAHPRQTVTSTIVNLVLTLVCSPEKRPDSFFTMIAGFVAATHKVMGTAVSAYFVQQLVKVFGQRYEKASGEQSDSGSRHLIALLAELYNMQVVSCSIIFDYVRVFLNTLSELNTELLLRIIQLCGPSLRRDDPYALGDILGSIKLANSKNMSVRTSFMVDEMKKLQSNKAKAVVRNRDLADQRTQLRKRIASLGGSQDVQPLRAGLNDIQGADKHGKWWLVGASWSGSHSGLGDGSRARSTREDADDSNKMMQTGGDDLGIPDLWQLAREQGFNTEVRQRIFVALHAATDYENAELLVRNLRLNKYQRKEISEVIVRSSERQSQYNPYYALVATRFTSDRELLFQFRRSLTTRLKKMGEDIDAGEGDEDEFDAEEAAGYEMRWVYNIAKMYGSLVARRCLRLADVVKHRNLATLQEKAHMFFEAMIISVLQECQGDDLKEVLGGLDASHARGLQYFLMKTVRQTDLLRDKKEKLAVQKRCDKAEHMLGASLTMESLR